MVSDLLTIRHLIKKYHTQTVIDDLSFSVQAGERVALFAPSGAGKTTLIHILSGLEASDGGSYAFAADCKPVTLFQETRLFPHLTVEENIFLPFQVQSRAISSTYWGLYQQWLEVCGLQNYTKHYPCQLSGGMKQKVALIRGMLENPRFILMDEPFSSIDHRSKNRILEHILHINPQVTLLFVTHQVEEIPSFAQSVLYFQSMCLKQPVKVDAAAFSSIISRLPFALGMLECQCSEQILPF